jgi:hypothetical protein
MNMNNENLKAIGKKAFNVIWAVCLLICGFFIGHYSYIVRGYNTEPKAVKKTTKDVSVAINESNEVLIIDRATGRFETYSDSVGTNIFKLYAAKMYQSNN